jgi:hypothetical protein
MMASREETVPESGKRERKAGRGLTAKALIISIAIAIFSNFMGTYVYNRTAVPIEPNPWPYSHLQGLTFTAMGLIFLSMVVVSLLSRSRKLGLSREELGVICASAMISTFPYGSYTAMYTVTYVSGSTKPALIGTAGKLMPSFWVPPKAAVDPIWLGGTAPDWLTLLPTVIIWIVAWLLWAFTGYFWGLIMRRRIVEIEQLPFPYAQPLVELVKMATEPEGKPRLFNFVENRGFWIAVIIGTLTYMPFMIRMFVPWFPIPATKEYGFYTWYMFNFYGDFGRWGASVLPTCYTNFYLNPETLAAAYFMPVEILFSAGWGLFLFYWVLSTIQAYTGLAPSPPPGGFQDHYEILTTYGRTGLFRPELVFDAGGSFAIGFWALVFSWKYIRDAFKYIWAPPKDEALEPIPYKVMWIGFFVSMILFLGFFTAMGIPVVMSLIMVVQLLLVWYASTRMAGEAGPISYWATYHTHNVNYWLGGLLGLWSIPAAGTPGERAAFVTVYATRQFFGYSMSSQPQALGLSGYKIASQTGTSNRDVFIIQVLTIVLVYIVSFVFTVGSLYDLGVERNLRSRPIVTGWSGADYSLIRGTWKWEDNIPWIAAAWVIVPVLMFLRMRFPWFWFDPIGLWIAARYVKLASAFWIMWFVKYAILKIGGTRLYEKGVPIAAGILVGVLLSKLIFALVAWVTGMVAPL